MLYPWHPWAGRPVHVHEVIERAGWAAFRCSLTGTAADRRLEVPAWMFDRSASRGWQVGAMPVVSVAALGALEARAVNAVATAGLEPLVADAIQARGISVPEAVVALATRLAREPDIDALSAMLRGLGAAHIAAAVDQWIALPSVEALPRTQVGSAAMFGVSGVPTPDIQQLSQIAAAATDLTAIKGDIAGDPRRALLDALPEDAIAKMVADAGDTATLERFLSAQVGMPLHANVESALADVARRILDGPLEAVAGLLGTLAELDRPCAIAWVDEVGEENLIARLPQEVPWASNPSIEAAPSPSSSSIP